MEKNGGQLNAVEKDSAAKNILVKAVFKHSFEQYSKGIKLKDSTKDAEKEFYLKRIDAVVGTIKLELRTGGIAQLTKKQQQKSYIDQAGHHIQKLLFAARKKAKERVKQKEIQKSSRMMTRKKDSQELDEDMSSQDSCYCADSTENLTEVFQSRSNKLIMF